MMKRMFGRFFELFCAAFWLWQPAGDNIAATAEPAVRFRNWRRLRFSMLFPYDVALIFSNNIITKKEGIRNNSFGIV